MDDKIKDVYNKATDYSGTKSRKTAKGLLAIVIVILLGALGLETGNKDFDLESLINGNSFSESEVVRDEKGNLAKDSNGNLLTRIMRDREGNVVSDSSKGKYTDEYNCDDFKTQKEAQSFFDKAGGLRDDTNRLDGDKDGMACESLPKGI